METRPTVLNKAGILQVGPENKVAGTSPPPAAELWERSCYILRTFGFPYSVWRATGLRLAALVSEKLGTNRPQVIKMKGRAALGLEFVSEVRYSAW